MYLLRERESETESGKQLTEPPTYCVGKQRGTSELAGIGHQEVITDQLLGSNT